MNVERWRACKNPEQMLRSVRATATSRQLRLFACACCWRLRELLEDGEDEETLFEALRKAARYAEGEIGSDELSVWEEWVREAFEDRQDHRLDLSDDSDYDEADEEPHAEAEMLAANAVLKTLACDEEMFAAALEVSELAAKAAGAKDMTEFLMDGIEAVNDDYYTVQEFYDESRDYSPAKAEKEEREAQAEIIRDLFYGPFNPPALTPTVRSPEVVSLASAIYASGSFSKLQDLINALQRPDTDYETLKLALHFLKPKHFKGCWAIDLLRENGSVGPPAS